MGIYPISKVIVRSASKEAGFVKVRPEVLASIVERHNNMGRFMKVRVG
jgi:hypothetical protein